MKARSDVLLFALFAAIFAGIYFAPVAHPRMTTAVGEALALTQGYAREHVILCLLPAFWIAGAIGAFVSQQSVMRYFGPRAPKTTSYGIASVSGTILAVCSCTVLPLFSGIYRMGAGLGPATAFLYSGPAINALALILTAKVLGLQLGLARALAAIGFSIVIGLLMHFIFRREEQAKAAKLAEMPEPPAGRPLRQTAIFFGLMVAILIFANWGRTSDATGFFATVYQLKWVLTAAASLALAGVLWRWFGLPALRLAITAAAVTATALFLPVPPEVSVLLAVAGLVWSTAGREGEAGEWFVGSWDNAKQILPLLLAGVFVAGLLLGRPGEEGLIPATWIASAVGGNSFGANAFASVAGAFMYFATLTEIPILQGLIGNGMGAGPSLTLLLAGPALSLPSMIVLHSILGLRKTATYVALVVVLSTFVGWTYGAYIA